MSNQFKAVMATPVLGTDKKWFSGEHITERALENYTDEEKKFIADNELDIRVFSLILIESEQHHPYHFIGTELRHDVAGIHYRQFSDSELLSRAGDVIGEGPRIHAVQWNMVKFYEVPAKKR